MKIVAIIPAHLASVRFPNKILFQFHGLPMIEHVRRRALLSGVISDVFVATCDDKIAEAIEGFGGKVIRTANTHTNGTSRIAEAIIQIDCTHVILLQGDEPLLLPRHLEAIADSMQKDPTGNAWNATGPIEYEEELDRHSFVKCAVSPSNRIMYCFRRSPAYSEFKNQQKFIRKILGLIAFEKNFLLEITKLPASIVETFEFIEQMRIVENGFKLTSVPVAPSLPSVNEPAEAEIVLNYIKNNEEQRGLLEQIMKF
ncbi:NTP transferase domain-containing protein [Aquirufa ecclesiirivi]|uniref:cytidylyltransferase domain-containing protein n=1 Tax=Aquirufa ecclesiirivi TaxID=2715124 RepID=UPI0022A81C73|nr:NTP transferase domain-containing protein [Aquirufa ecclesiirivi]MCZ2473339.1 NTP transferase domain-containing protein [Aquirufa ecclesiirivi]